MTNIPLLVAFIAGVVSFLSPCVLPLVPGYLAYLAGVSVGDETRKRKEILVHSVCFVVGFAVVFALLGVLLNTILESIAYDAQRWFSRVGGVLVIGFGLYLMELIRIPGLERGHAISVRRSFSSRYVSSFVFGAAFAAGWTPCVGAVLGAILGLAATQPGIAFTLLLSYAIGFGIPFLLVGAFTPQASKLIDRFGSRVGVINKIFGGFLVILGVLIFTNTLSRYANLDILTQLFFN